MMLSRTKLFVTPLMLGSRHFTSKSSKAAFDYATDRAERNRRIGMYCLAVTIGTVGASYAAVPLYKAFCKMTGFGGETQRVVDFNAMDKVTPVQGYRPITVSFDGNAARSMPWSFDPIQRKIKVVPGETALAFYRAKNNSDKAVIGVATYNVVPTKCGVYFNKIQCFCFEEQRLRPREEVDMPVFFFIDPDFAKDPNMRDVSHITLSYTFWKSTGSDDVEEHAAGQALPI